VAIGYDNKAAMSLCKARKEGQRVKHVDIIHHLARDLLKIWSNHARMHP
jgi:hypothetical protein